MNKSILMGRLVRDPEVRYSQTEKGELVVANFRIAVDRKFVKKDGVTADYFSCSAFGRLAEFAENYLMQGIKVVVTGRMENENYTNRDGEKVYAVRLLAEDIEFAESKKVSEERMEEAEHKGRDQERNSGSSSGKRTVQSDRKASSSRSQNAESRTRSGSSRNADREAEYEENGGKGSSGRRTERERSAGDRGYTSGSSGERSSRSAAATRRSQERNRNIDDAYMNYDMEDDDLDFD